MLALGHGAGGGIEARDLRALAQALPADGVTVALVEQPWRVAGKKVAPAPKTLDAAWRALWPALAARRAAGRRGRAQRGRPGGLPYGRGSWGAHAVLALSFPLHPPGKPEKSRAEELTGAGLPTLVVQGGRDPFGRPGSSPRARGSWRCRTATTASRCRSGRTSARRRRWTSSPTPVAGWLRRHVAGWRPAPRAAS